MSGVFDAERLEMDIFLVLVKGHAAVVSIYLELVGLAACLGPGAPHLQAWLGRPCWKEARLAPLGLSAHAPCLTAWSTHLQQCEHTS